MKIAVCTISKNEAKFVRRFCNSATNADLILIADTGSTDDTVNIAKECGATVYSISIVPWRFDTARNAALALLPADIDLCISIDLDEVLEEGWREEIERVWELGITTRLRYQYDWGNGKQFQNDKIFARHGYSFHHPCHEVPRADGRITEVYSATGKLLVSHHPDATKSRGQYLDLLELSVREDPSCPRNAWYYARELYFNFRWSDAIDKILEYLAMPSAVWIAERSYAMRVMAECHQKLKNNYAAEMWFHKAAAEHPMARESWVALSELMYSQSRWEECLAYASRALRIHHRMNDYTCEPSAYGAKPHDLAAIAAWRMGLKDVAIEQGKLALQFAPNDRRLLDNLSWYQGDK